MKKTGDPRKENSFISMMNEERRGVKARKYIHSLDE